MYQDILLWPGYIVTGHRLQPVTLRQRDMEKHLWSSSQSLWGNWFNKPKYFSLSRQDIILKIYNNSKQLGDDTIPFAI